MLVTTSVLIIDTASSQH